MRRKGDEVVIGRRQEEVRWCRDGDSEEVHICKREKVRRCSKEGESKVEIREKVNKGR